MIEIVFWSILFLKNVFWYFFENQYFLGTLVWISILSAISFYKFWKLKFSFTYRGNFLSRLVLVYLFWCVVCCFLPWVEFKVASVIYAFLPLIILPFIPKSFFVENSLRNVSKGLVVSAFITSVIMLINLGGMGISSRFEGLDSIGPNTMALLAALAFFSCIYLWKSCTQRKKVFLNLLAIYFFAILMLTLSKTTIFAVFLVILLGGLGLGGRRSGGVLIFLVLILYFVLYFFAADYFDKYFSGNYSYDTLSGRTVLWESIFDHLNGLSFYFGTGFNSSEKISRLAGLSAFGVDTVSHAHNSYVEAFVNVGLFGVVLLVLIFHLALIGIYVLMKKSSPNKALFVIIFSWLAILWVRSFSEGSISQPGTMESIFLIFLVLLFASNYEQWFRGRFSR